MRTIGILLLIAGLFYAVAKPWFGSNFTGEEIARATIFDKTKSNNENRGWRVSEVLLQGEHPSLRVRLNVLRLPGQIYDNGNLKLLVRVAPVGQSGTALSPLVSEELTVNLENPASSATGSTEPYLVSKTTGEFSLTRSGQYKIGALPVPGTDGVALNIDANVIGIEAQVLSGVEATGSGSSLLGVVMAIFGIVLMSIAKRRKKLGNIAVAGAPAAPMDEAPPEPAPPPVAKAKPKPVAKPKTDVGKTIKWGRDAGKKR